MFSPAPVKMFVVPLPFSSIRLGLCDDAVPEAASLPAAPPGRWVAHRVVFPGTRIDLSHLGVHTHADFLRFDLGRLDLATMQADKAAQHYRDVRAAGHCRLPTDHAALPPGFEAFQTNVGPIPTYGPIDGKPGWSFTVSTEKGRNWVTFSVPTRFSNWVAAQSSALRRRYRNPGIYSLEITWMEWEG